MQILTNNEAAIVSEFLGNQWLRLNNLYWVVNKEGVPVKFRLNWAQRELFETAHTRNNILKVRQLGMSTYIAMLILDSCLFNSNFKAGIVDKTLKDAQAKLQKIAFAFENLDRAEEGGEEFAVIGKELKESMKGVKLGKESIVFPNGSEIHIGTSLRGGTLQLLHVSELGSIACHDPMRATEIITGSLNAVGKNCQIFMESTHEGGRYGVNYEQVIAAMDNIGKELSPLDFKFYFFPWWRHKEYQLDDKVPISVEQEKYFQGIETQCNIKLSDKQKWWYVAMGKTMRSFMRQEYPSTPEEALTPIVEGTIYSGEIMALRERGQAVAEYEVQSHRPIYVSWDFGIGDYMSLWWFQPTGDGRWLVLGNYTAHQKPLSHYIDVMRERDAEWGRCAACIVPHDGAKRDIMLIPQDDGLRKAGYSVIRVPRTGDLWASIDNTREFLLTCIFHKRCSDPTICENVKYIAGMDALSNYRVAPPAATGTLATRPLHDVTSHAADAMRCFADAVQRGLVSPEIGWQQGGKKKRSERSNFVNNILN